MAAKKISERKLELLDLENVSKNPSGRRMLGRFMARAGVLNNTFHEEDRFHVLADGQRQFGLWIFNELKEVDDELPFNILKEFYYERDREPRPGDDGSRRTEPGADSPEFTG